MDDQDRVADQIADVRGVGRPATGALRLAGYLTLQDLDGASRRSLLALHGVGPKAIRVLEPELARRGLALAD